MPTGKVLFQETQRFRQPVLLVLILGGGWITAGIYIYLLISHFVFGQRVGDDWAMIFFSSVAILIGLGVPIVFLASKLETRVGDDGLYVRFFPFHHLRFLYR